MRIIPYSFASYSGHCNSCIALFRMTLHTNQSVSNTLESHYLTSNEYTHNMYIIYIPELDISSLFLFIFRQKYFSDPLSAIPFLLEEFYQHHLWHHSYDT